MPTAATLAEALAPLRAEPAPSAVLLDVDGTLAPIVRHADDAAVPEATRTLLIQVARRYGCVACVSGRRASIARQIVSLGTITYVGNHGAEVLRAGRRSRTSTARPARGSGACTSSPTAPTTSDCSACASASRTRARSWPSTGVARRTRRRRTRR